MALDMHARTLAALAAGLIVIGPTPAEAQLADHLRDAVKQGVEDRRRATEDALAMRSMMLGDSIAALGLAPVGGLADDLAAGAESAVTTVAAILSRAGDDPADELRAGLEAGRVELAGVFLPATAEPSPEGEELLRVLASLIIERAEPVLLEAFVSDSSPDDLAERRVRIARMLLSAHGTDPGMLFGSTDGIPVDDATGEGGAAASDLRVRPLR